MGISYFKPSPKSTHIQDQLQIKQQPFNSTKCYNGHPLTYWKTEQDYTTYGPVSYCNECSKQKHVSLICVICNYKVCSKCNFVRHNDICQNPKMKFSPINYCSYCEFEKKGIIACQSCNFHVCYDCQSYRHSLVCKQDKFVFKEDKENKQYCNFCGIDNLSFMCCQSCKMRICNSCRKFRNWK